MRGCHRSSSYNWRGDHTHHGMYIGSILAVHPNLYSFSGDLCRQPLSTGAGQSRLLFELRLMHCATLPNSATMPAAYSYALDEVALAYRPMP